MQGDSSADEHLMTISKRNLSTPKLQLKLSPLDQQNCIHKASVLLLMANLFMRLSKGPSEHSDINVNELIQVTGSICSLLLCILHSTFRERLMLMLILMALAGLYVSEASTK